MNNKIFTLVIGLIFSVIILQGCAEDISSTGDDNLGPNAKTINPAADLPARLAGDVYYTGYDGIHISEFAVFVRTRRQLELVDNGPDRVADIRKETIDIPIETVNAMIDKLAAVETVDQARRADLVDRLSSASRWVITPRKAGIATIKATRISRRTNQIRRDSVWYEPELRTLVVQAYSADQIAIGEDRYNNSNSACIGCHANSTISNTGAPSHQIGRVGQISDADAISWITTGRAGDRTFTSNGFSNPGGHSWFFSNTYEAASTIAYLRTQQTKDLTELAQLLFDEVVAEAKTDAAN